MSIQLDMDDHGEERPADLMSFDTKELDSKCTVFIKQNAGGNMSNGEF